MLAGDILLKKYILIKKIGSGEFSDVWLCFHSQKRQYFAMKIFDSDNYKQGFSELNFLKKMRSFNCPYCITFYKYFVKNDMLFIIQELMAGSLYQIMKSQFMNGFPIELVQIFTIQVLYALKFLHEQLKIIHADIKPENILLVGRSADVEQTIQKINIDGFYRTNKSKNVNTLSNYIKTEIYKINQSNKKDKYINETDESEKSIQQYQTDSDIVSSESSDASRDFLESDSEYNFADNTDYSTFINQKYLKNPRIVLADFGNCIDIQKNSVIGYGDIQTRHYRSPEIILRLPLNEKMDIWALGCTVYELLTGKILFDPHKKNEMTTDLSHLYQIQQLFGIFPMEYQKSRKYDIFFKDICLLKHFNHINPIDFYQLLCKQINSYEDNVKLCYYFMIKCFRYDINKRPSATFLINDKFVNNK